MEKEWNMDRWLRYITFYNYLFKKGSYPKTSVKCMESGSDREGANKIRKEKGRLNQIGVKIEKPSNEGWDKAYQIRRSDWDIEERRSINIF